jgi:hypothetical protein
MRRLCVPPQQNRHRNRGRTRSHAESRSKAVYARSALARAPSEYRARVIRAGGYSRSKGTRRNPLRVRRVRRVRRHSRRKGTLSTPATPTAKPGFLERDSRGLPPAVGRDLVRGRRQPLLHPKVAPPARCNPNRACISIILFRDHVPIYRILYPLLSFTSRPLSCIVHNPLSQARASAVRGRTSKTAAKKRPFGDGATPQQRPSPASAGSDAARRAVRAQRKRQPSAQAPAQGLEIGFRVQGSGAHAWAA